MAGFDVSILLRLIDQLTSPAKRAGQSYADMSKSITQGSNQIRNASRMAAQGVSQVGVAASRAQASVSKFFTTMNRLQQRNKGAGGGNTMIGNGDAFRAFGGWMALRNSLAAAEETQKAENKFRALVDSVSANQMQDIRSKLMDRMMRTGETYADLMDAAGDAAQIMGDATQAANVALTASKLKNVDTAGKTLGDFSNTIASIVKAGASASDIQRLGDMLVMQQKLGAATAGGSIEAYKQAAQMISFGKVSQADAFTAIGMIKNKTPALQDSQIGTNLAWGIRLFNSEPDGKFAKRMQAADLTRESFLTDGKFDLFKGAEALQKVRAGKDGEAKIRALFSGKNFQASKFWMDMLDFPLEELRKYRAELTGGAGVMDKADEVRLEGLVGKLNKLRGSVFRLSLAFGQLLTPAIGALGDTLAWVSNPLGDFVGRFAANHGFISGAVGTWLGLVAALSMLGLVSGRAATAAGLVFKLPWWIGAGVLQGLRVGLFGTAAGIFRFAGALGVLRTALAVLTGPIGWVIGGLSLLYSYWDQIKSFGSGFASMFKGSEVEGWLSSFAAWSSSSMVQLFTWLQGIAPGLASALTSIGEAISSIFSFGSSGNSATGEGQWSWFDAGAKAAEKLLNPLRSIQGIGASIQGLFNWGETAAAGAVIGVPDSMRGAAQQAKQGMRNPRGGGGVSPMMPQGMSMQQQGPTVNFTQAPPSIVNNVTVNVAQSNADPNAIGAAAAGAVGSKVRGALSDAPHSAP